MVGLTPSLLAVLAAVFLLALFGLGVGVVAVWWIWHRRASRASTPPATGPSPTPPESAELDEEITVIGFPPIQWDEGPTDHADAEVTDVGDFGKVQHIVHDSSVADDEPTAAQPLILVSAVGQTHRGRRRRNNQDAFLVMDQDKVFVVADGMGGHAGGEVASQLACETITGAFERNDFVGTMPTGLHRDGAHLAAAIQMANRAVWDRAGLDDSLRGMGTTVVGACFSPLKGRVFIGHVGDSRCYRYRAGQLEQLTQDHTLEQVGVSGPNAGALTRAVGIAPAVDVDLIVARPESDDIYLLCSDGLTKMIPDPQIRSVLDRGESPESAVQRLIEEANAAGGRDNVTVIVVRVQKPPP